MSLTHPWKTILKKKKNGCIIFSIYGRPHEKVRSLGNLSNIRAMHGVASQSNRKTTYKFMIGWSGEGYFQTEII